MFDVIVVGGGIMGASTAYTLQNMGKKVLLLEQFEAGHSKGSSHGDGRIVRFNYSESIYVEMAKLGYPAWEALSKAAGQELLRRTGILEMASFNSQELSQSESHLLSNGISYEKLSPEAAKKRFPQYRFQNDAAILYQADGAVAFASPAVLALWRLFKQGGGTAVTGKKVTKIDVTEASVSVTCTSGETFVSERLVLATGAWSKEVAESLDLDLPLEVSHEILAYFPVKDSAFNHHVGAMPVMIEYLDGEEPFYCLPIVEVQGVKVGWHHTGQVIRADDEREISEAILARMRRWIGDTFPALDPQEIEIASCLYTNTPDYHFILDKHPKYNTIAIAAGFSGHGFKFGPIIGEIMAALVMDETVPLSLDSFKISRFQQAVLDKHIGA